MSISLRGGAGRLALTLALMAAAAAHGQHAVPPPAAAAIPVDATCDEARKLRARQMGTQTSPGDWANLGRYREANSLLPPPRAGTTRVVFLGDSITEMWADERCSGWFAQRPYINRGISGQHTGQMLLRMHADVIALQPHVLMFLGGTNDILGSRSVDQIADNIAMIAEVATTHGIEVVLSSVLPTSDYHVAPGDSSPPPTARRPPATIRALNDWMRTYAREHNHGYLDYYTAMSDAHGLLKSELTNDGVHPNPAGYAVMEPLAQAAIVRAAANP
jgi:lysophospholipase L1-like esterase